MQGITAFLSYVDHHSYPLCRAGCSLPAERSISCENCDVPKYIFLNLHHFGRRVGSVMVIAVV
jgi:hypothetical protein